MPTPSPRLGLLVPTTADDFSTADIATNWDTLDDTPGFFVCTSGTRPAWGAAQAGQTISETDTGLDWKWDGVHWSRTSAMGLLKTTTGAWAISQRTSDFITSSSTYVIVTSVTNVVVPPGNRTLQFTVNYYRSEAGGTGSYFVGAVFRSNTAATGVVEFNFACPDNGAGNAVGFLPGGLAAGTYAWSFQVHESSTSTTATVRGTTTTPVQLSVQEI